MNACDRHFVHATSSRVSHVLERTFTALFTAALEAAEANYSIFSCKLYGRAAAEVNYSLFSKANFYGCAAAEVNYSIFSIELLRPRSGRSEL